MNAATAPLQARFAGPEGVLADTAVGSAIFGIAPVLAAYRIANRSGRPEAASGAGA